DANLLPELLQHLPVRSTARGRSKDHLEFDGLAVILDQRLRLLEVVRQGAIILALDPGTLAIGVAGWTRQAIGGGLRPFLAVYRHDKRLANAHVVKRSGLGIDGVNRSSRTDISVHGQLGIFLRPQDV